MPPKLSHSRDPEEFGCRRREDLGEVADLVTRFGLRSAWIMPEGRRIDEISTNLENRADAVIERGWKLTTRLHVLI